MMWEYANNHLLVSLFTTFNHRTDTYMNNASCDTDNSYSLLSQESQDIIADPVQEPSTQEHSLYCGDFVKYYTSDEISESDSDVTPDLDFLTTSNCDNEDSKNFVRIIIKNPFWDSDDSDYTSDFSIDSDLKKR